MDLNSKPNPAGLLLEVSRHAALETEPAEFLQQVANAILEHAASDAVSITLSDPRTGQSYQVSKESDTKVKDDAFRSFVSRDVLVRRVRYGHLELRSANSQIHRGDFLIAFDALTEQLARFAEFHSSRQQSTALRREVDQLTSAVKESKTVARASNLLTAARHFAARAVPRYPRHYSVGPVALQRQR